MRALAPYCMVAPRGLASGRQQQSHSLAGTRGGRTDAGGGRAASSCGRAGGQAGWLVAGGGGPSVMEYPLQSRRALSLARGPAWRRSQRRRFSCCSWRPAVRGARHPAGQTPRAVRHVHTQGHSQTPCRTDTESRQTRTHTGTQPDTLPDRHREPSDTYTHRDTARHPAGQTPRAVRHVHTQGHSQTPCHTDTERRQTRTHRDTARHPAGQIPRAVRHVHTQGHSQTPCRTDTESRQTRAHTGTQPDTLPDRHREPSDTYTHRDTARHPAGQTPVRHDTQPDTLPDRHREPSDTYTHRDTARHPAGQTPRAVRHVHTQGHSPPCRTDTESRQTRTHTGTQPDTLPDRHREP